MTKLRAAMLQTRVYADKMENIREAGRKLEALEAEQVDLVTCLLYTSPPWFPLRWM